MRLATAVIGAIIAGAVPACADEGAEVAAMFVATFGTTCDLHDDGRAPAPDVYNLVYKPTFDGIFASPRSLTLYRFACSQGAYNVTHVFISASEDDGIRPVYFAQPTYHVVYDQPGNGVQADEKVLQIQLTGIASYDRLANSEVDLVSGTVTSTAWWRGLGDASSLGEWRLVDGAFTLVRFDVDASYDGEINRARLINYLGPSALR